jgi:hypothetical protein
MMFEKTRTKIADAASQIDVGVREAVWAVSCAIVLSAIIISIGLVMIAAAL